MKAALATVWIASEPEAPYGAPRPDAPLPDLARATASDAVALRTGEREVEQYDLLLASVGRLRGQVDVALAEGLHVLQRKTHLARTGFRLVDFGRELLDLGKRATFKLAELGGALRERPLLRAAMRDGRVKLRTAETVLPVAKGSLEGWWVHAAETMTVRQLEQTVRQARKSAGDDDEDQPWHRLGIRLTPEETEEVERGFEVARAIAPEASRTDQLELMAMEFLGSFPATPDTDPSLALGFKLIGGGRGRDTDAKRAALEADCCGWEHLPHDEGQWSCDRYLVRDDDSTDVVVGKLRDLAALRKNLDHMVGSIGLAFKQSGAHLRFGFASFNHYVDERVKLPVRTVQQRIALEKRIQGSRALTAVRDAGLSLERLRLLSRLPESEIAAWGERAASMPCAALEHALTDHDAAQTRALGKLSLPLPQRIASLLAAVFAEVRRCAGPQTSPGRALAVMAKHFADAWEGHVPKKKTVSQKVRERDKHRCQAPGCSARGAHAHHRKYRSHGGGNALADQIALCVWHHLVCVHHGHLRVVKDADTGELSWWLEGRLFTGLAPVRH